MSVAIDAFTVDWPELESHWKEGADSFSLWDAVENEEPWISNYTADDWIDSWGVTIDFSDHYKQLRSAVPVSCVNELDRFLGAFCVTDENEAFTPPRDLGPDIDEEMIFGSLNCESVAGYLALGKRLDFSVLREPFERHCKPERFFSTSEDYVSYCSMWVHLLDGAHEEKRGIVLWVG